MNGSKVLIVEDNDDNRIIYATMLQYLGFEVIEARDGEAALASARDDQPDLILLDISIPKIDGWTVAAMLKANPRTKPIPIIALTAHAMRSDHDKSLEVGCDAYLSKPVDPRTVAREVKKWLRPREFGPEG